MTDHENTELLASVAKAKVPQITEWFKPFIERWPNEAGKKLTNTQAKLAYLLYDKKRVGVEMAFVAMLLRDSGCSDAQHAAAFSCKTAHNNAWGRVGMTAMGVVQRTSEKHEG